MKGYKIPEGRVEGFKRWIEKYPKDMEYAWGMSAIVEALEIYPLEELDENPWHTGTPTEEGWYVLYTSKPHASYHLAFYQFGHWFSTDEYCIIREDVVAWQKIEPYEEN